MAVPVNQKLWAMLIARAKTKFRVFPSPAASHWVHQQYVQLGGRFVESQKQVPNKLRDKSDDKKKKDEEKRDK